MQISFDPKDPRDVADTMNVLRILGMIDAAVSVTIGDEPSLTAIQARELQRELDAEQRGLSARHKINPRGGYHPSNTAQVNTKTSRTPEIIPLEDLDL